MSGQSWKQAVEDLAGPAPTVTPAYIFSGSGPDEDSLDTEGKKKKRLSGLFFERKLHGAFNE